MNKTFGDLMGEYTGVREQAKRFSSWEALDKFVEELVEQVVPKDEKTLTHKFQEYSFDANGVETHE